MIFTEKFVETVLEAFSTVNDEYMDRFEFPIVTDKHNIIFGREFGVSNNKIEGVSIGSTGSTVRIQFFSTALSLLAQFPIVIGDDVAGGYLTITLTENTEPLVSLKYEDLTDLFRDYMEYLCARREGIYGEVIIACANRVVSLGKGLFRIIIHEKNMFDSSEEVSLKIWNDSTSYDQVNGIKEGFSLEDVTPKFLEEYSNPTVAERMYLFRGGGAYYYSLYDGIVRGTRGISSFGVAV